MWFKQGGELSRVHILIKLTKLFLGLFVVIHEIKFKILFTNENYIQRVFKRDNFIDS